MRKNTETLFVPLLILLIAGWWNLCFAETFSQKDGLFTIDLPEGWKWTETSEDITVENPQDPLSNITITFEPMAKKTDIGAKFVLQTFAFGGVKDMIKAHNGTIISERDRSIDGVYARQLDYVDYMGPHRKRMFQMSFIAFYHKDNLIFVVFGSPSKEGKLKTDNIVETLRLH